MIASILSFLFSLAVVWLIILPATLYVLAAIAVSMPVLILVAIAAAWYYFPDTMGPIFFSVALFVVPAWISVKINNRKERLNVNNRTGRKL